MNSALYIGTVRHTRLRPFRHDFAYRVFYGLFDIDELANLGSRLRLFGARRPINVLEKDHGPQDGSPLRPWVNNVLSDAGVDITGGRVMLLAYPRMFGFVFNPISIWYCFDADGELRAVLHEVRNTFGDKHVYVVPVDNDGLGHTFDKRLHVSPFMAMAGEYRFSMSLPGDRLAVGIRHFDSGGELFRAGLSGTRHELTDRTLLKALVTHPLMTLKVVGSIHWQALLLWRKGAKFHKRPEPPTAAHSIVTRTPLATLEIT